MAFVADYNDEELRRALEAAGGSPAIDGGPGPAPVGLATPAGPTVPSPGAAPAGGPGAGTGFVNLSRYFDANQPGAGAVANQILDPLGQKISGAVARTDAAKEPLPDILPGATGNDFGDYKNEIRAEKGQASAIAAGENAIKAAKNNATSTVQGYLADPNALSAALTGGGTKTPSSFDAYMTGAALPGAFQGFQDYFGKLQSTGPAPSAPPAPSQAPAPVYQKPPTTAADIYAPPATRSGRRRGDGTREP